MIGMGEVLPRVLGAGMGRNEQVIAGVETDVATAAPNPQALADQPKGRGIEGLLEDHIAVAVEGHLFPGGQVIHGRRERLELQLLDALEALERLRFGGAVDALSSQRAAPVEHITIGLRDTGW